MKILLIDDENFTITSLKHSIEGLGHDTRIARHVDEAISLITRDDFDLIICDVMMPGISGLSLVTILRTVHLIFTPVIMISSLHNRHLVEAAMEAGADGFIYKPVDINELNAKIKMFEKVQ